MRAVLAVWRAAFQEAWAKPLALGIDILLMILNNLVWVGFWSIVFGHVDAVRGWDLSKLFLFFAVVTAVFGVVLGLFYNVRKLGGLISRGELDSALTLPLHPLAYLSVRRVHAANMGDIVFGFGVFFLFCDPTPARFLIFLVVVTLGSVVMLSFLLALGALTLHFGGKGEAQDIGFDGITMFAFFPLDMFGGPTKLFLYTVLPSAFITGIPAELVDELNWVNLLALFIAAVVFALTAWATFVSGLRKYRSGSRWTTA